MFSSPRDEVLVGGGQGGGIVSSICTAIFLTILRALEKTQSLVYHSLKCLSLGVDGKADS